MALQGQALSKLVTYVWRLVFPFLHTNSTSLHACALRLQAVCRAAKRLTSSLPSSVNVCPKPHAPPYSSGAVTTRHSLGSL